MRVIWVLQQHLGKGGKTTFEMLSLFRHTEFEVPGGQQEGCAEVPLKDRTSLSLQNGQVHSRNIEFTGYAHCSRLW